MVCRSFDEMIRTCSDEFKDTVGIYEKINGSYIGKSFGEFYTDVRSLTEKLLDMGLRNKNIMLYGKNSYNWMVVYMAVIAYVGVIVPVDKEWKTNDIDNIISDTKIDYIFYSDYLKDNLKNTGVPKTNLENETTDLIKQGQGLTDIKRVEYEENPDRICSVMFTSGTTSRPKKIALSEKNLTANGPELEKLIFISPADRYMLSLPLSHIAPVLASFIYPMSMGAGLYIPNDFKEMAEDLKLVRPTVFYGVPKIFEEIWNAVPPDKKKKINRGIKISDFLRGFKIDKRKKIFAEFHESLGGAVRFAYSGAVKIDDWILNIFNDMGLIILQAYGMTESAAIISFDSINNYKLGSVGKVLPNQVCKIIEKNAGGIGEICVKGDNVAKSAVSGDGYLHTGDLGYTDKNGYLFITGRKKRLIKLSNAKNIYPDELEELLLQNADIKEAHVYEENGLLAASVVSVCGLTTDINKFVESINDTLPPYKHIRQISVKISIKKT